MAKRNLKWRLDVQQLLRSFPHIATSKYPTAEHAPASIVKALGKLQSLLRKRIRLASSDRIILCQHNGAGPKTFKEAQYKKI
jgi:hypothetical protein